MRVEQFADFLDRFGTDFAAWPADEAERARRLLTFSREARRRYRALAGIESWLDSSRPNFALGDGRALVRRALFEIAQNEARPIFLDRMRAVLSAPLPGLALALSLAAIGFVIGWAVGNPHADHAAVRSGGPMIAVADDGLF